MRAYGPVKAPTPRSRIHVNSECGPSAPDRAHRQIHNVPDQITCLCEKFLQPEQVVQRGLAQEYPWHGSIQSRWRRRLRFGLKTCPVSEVTGLCWPLAGDNRNQLLSNPSHSATFQKTQTP